MTRTITWAYVTEPGATPNKTWNRDAPRVMFKYFSTFLDLNFLEVQANQNPRVKIIFPRATIKGWMDSLQSALRMRIHPDPVLCNWNNSLPACAQITGHEFAHLATLRFGSLHIPPQNPRTHIMELYPPHPFTDWTQRDWQYVDAYPVRSADRPWHPKFKGLFKQMTTGPVKSGDTFLLTAEQEQMHASIFAGSEIPVCPHCEDSWWTRTTNRISSLFVSKSSLVP
jgi:hypothetical protein